jgi:hypothetical protein
MRKTYYTYLYKKNCPLEDGSSGSKHAGDIKN